MKKVVGISAAASAVSAALLVAPSAAFAAASACNSDNNFRLCMFRNSDGYSATVCNQNTNGAGTPIHLVLRPKNSPYVFTPVQGNKTIYGVTDTSRSCFSIRAYVPLTTAVKFAAASTPGSGYIYVGVENSLS